MGDSVHRTRTISVAAAALICTVSPAANAHAAISVGARAKVAASVDKSPAVGDGSVRAIGRHRAVVRLAVSYPDLPRGESHRATVTVFPKPSSERPIARRTQTVKLDRGRVGHVRAVFNGGAGTRLASAAKHGGRRGGRRGLPLVAVEVMHGRDLFGGHRIDHIWHFTERGLALAKHLRSRRSNATTKTPTGGVLDRVVDVTVSSSQPETVLLSSGNVTCTDGADALNGATLTAGQHRTMNVTLHDGGIVGTNLGVGTNSDTAAALWSPEARTFAFEMNIAYSPWAVEGELVFGHGLELRYDNLLGFRQGLPAIGLPCVTEASTFLVASDGVSSGDHAADIYQVGGLPHDLDVREFPGGELGQTGFQQTAGDVSHGLGDDKVTIQVNNGPGPGQLSGGCPDPRSWMQCTFENGVNDDVPLWDVTFPGTHDSATVNLGSTLETNATGGCSHLPAAARVGAAVSRNWAVSQTLNLREQLEAGIRYLDIRAAYDGGDWRPIHSLYSQSDLTQEVQTIAAWARQHPQEIVIADFNHICPFDGGSTQRMELFQDALDTQAPYSNVSLCDVSYPIHSTGDEAASDLMSRTIADVRKTGRNVIVLLDAGPGNGPLQTPGASDFQWTQQVLDACGYGLEKTPDYSKPVDTRYVPVVDMWPNQAGPSFRERSGPYNLCADPSEAEADNRAIEGYPLNPVPNAQVPPNSPTLYDYHTKNPIPLMQTQMLYTLSALSGVDQGVLLGTGCPGSLIDWGQSLHPNSAPYTRADILAAWGPMTNVVITDSIDSQYVSQAVELNPSSRRFYLKNSFSSGAADAEVPFGAIGDLPLTGDWNRDGTDTIGFYRPSNQTFYVRNSSSPGPPDIVAPFGDYGDLPLIGDWNGDATDTIGVYRPSTRTFYVKNSFSSGAADLEVRFGDTGEVPIIGDWNGDGIDTIGVYQPSTQTFFVKNSFSSGVADAEARFGGPGDLPVTGDWNGDGADSIGFYRPSTATFYLRNSISSGGADIEVPFGNSGDIPITGDWNGDRIDTIGVYR